MGTGLSISTAPYLIPSQRQAIKASSWVTLNRLVLRATSVRHPPPFGTGDSPGFPSGRTSMNEGVGGGFGIERTPGTARCSRENWSMKASHRGTQDGFDRASSSSPRGE
jgi:hypothetical protein